LFLFREPGVSLIPELVKQLTHLMRVRMVSSVLRTQELLKKEEI